MMPPNQGPSEDLASYVAELGMPADFLARPQPTVAERDLVDEVLAHVDAGVRDRKRNFVFGLALAFAAFAEDLAQQLSPGESLANALERYQPMTFKGKRKVNTLSVKGPMREVGIRKYYNAAETVIRSRLRRGDYPNMAPHATQAWDQERTILDRLLAASPAVRSAVVREVWSRILATYRPFATRRGERPTERPFSTIVTLLPGTQKGEPPGALLQAIAFAYFRADAPNVYLETGKVGAGSSRTGRVADIDGRAGADVVLAIEVKDMDLEDVSYVDGELAGFVANLADWPDATAVVLARSFTGGVVDHLSANGIFTLDREQIARNVALWELRKQEEAMIALRYYLERVQSHSRLLDRVVEFAQERGIHF